MVHKEHPGKAFQDTARGAQSCQSICVESIQHCLELGGSHVEPSHMRLMQDCADICETTAMFLLRGSPEHRQITAACAAICELCARSCDKFAGDPQMKACADECRHCAEACQKLVPQQPGGTAGTGHRGVL
ncbi:ferredoxin [Sorangium cellulosum]|uniref:Ferredoxin n=1 Tax=Sorangium cellulosum TaxID=56 RepID=A0A2L0F9N8_SORCE|nr:four-helix bundle copper-binding protein [Sorangium cellulosum]AUX48306.1 ferredoxin [Sorangium cellulosum]